MSAPPPRRILIRAPNWLGDAVLALPAMGAVRAAYPEAALTVAAVRPVAPLFLERTAVRPDGVLAVDKAGELELLREAQPDLAIILPNSFRSAWICRRAGIPERWGYRASARRLLLTRAIGRPPRSVHQADYYRHLVAACGIDAPGGDPSIAIAPDTAARAQALLASSGVAPGAAVVGIAPGAAYGHAKRWPPARAAELAARLGADGASVVLVGAPGDRSAGREIESSLPGGAAVVNLIGRTDLRLFAGVLAACHAFVANDSGAMHLAAAVGGPVTAIFGPTDERATAPLGDHDVIIHQVFCRPCMLRECPIDHRCMRGIPVQRVHDSVMRHLEARRHAPGIRHL